MYCRMRMIKTKGKNENINVKDKQKETTIAVSSYCLHWMFMLLYLSLSTALMAKKLTFVLCYVFSVLSILFLGQCWISTFADSRVIPCVFSGMNNGQHVYGCRGYIGPEKHVVIV